MELYNPADVFQAFADAAREGVWSEGDGDSDDADVAAAEADQFGTPIPGPDPYAAAADQWAAAA